VLRFIVIILFGIFILLNNVNAGSNKPHVFKSFSFKDKPSSSKSKILKLVNHPRLWVEKETVRSLSQKLHTPYLKESAKRVLEDADWLLEQKPIAEGEARAYQTGTRAISSHLQCLTGAWVLTKERKYRNAAIKHLSNILNWKHISCEARINTSPNTELPFCLSYGEHAADIALMYDFFRSDITAEEQKVFFDVIDKFYLKEALKCTTNPPWWVNKSWSNWNGVCAGGIGMLALAFYDDRPECQKLIPFVEKSLGEYFKSYIKNGGGCHEGTGYWNYGMHYAMRYLLSWENATGKKHPAFGIKELGYSLNFPLDFTGITFGDNDGWHPGGFFFMLAKKLNRPTAGLRAATYLKINSKAKRKRKRFMRTHTADILYAADYIPTTEMMSKLKETRIKKKEPIVHVYKGLGWASMADDSAYPSLRLSARGGTSEITGHGMMDLLSFKFMQNGQKMIEDQAGSSPVSYTGRGHHIYGRSAASKSTLFVDGLGCREDAVCTATEAVKGNGIQGIRIDGSRVYMKRWWNTFIGRLFLMVDSRYCLVIDRVYDENIANGHWIESRFHTFATTTKGADWVRLIKGPETMTMTFASLGKGVMQESSGMPSLPRKQSQIFRWMSARPSYSQLQVTALNPGAEKIEIKVMKGKKGYFDILIKAKDGYQRTIVISSKLELKK